MAAQRVQSYLDKHKVGQLFEDLMAKVIHDMPSKPVSYLIRVLQKKEARIVGVSASASHTPTKSAATPKPKLNALGNVRPLRSSTSKSESHSNATRTTREPRDASTSIAMATETSASCRYRSDDVAQYSFQEEQVYPLSERGQLVDREEKRAEKIRPSAKQLRKAKADRRCRLSSLLNANRSEALPKESAATEDGGDREGTDLLENLDVLEEEGVHLSAASGVGIRRKSPIELINGGQQQKIICARCAQLIEGGSLQLSDNQSTVDFASTVTLADNERDDFYFDDDFESASQVGPGSNTTPIWFGEERGIKTGSLVNSQLGADDDSTSDWRVFDSSNQLRLDVIPPRSLVEGKRSVTPRSNSRRGGQERRPVDSPRRSARSRGGGLLQMLQDDSEDSEPQMKSVPLRGSTVRNLLDDEDPRPSRRGLRSGPPRSSDMYSDDESTGEQTRRGPPSLLGSEL